MSEVAEKSVKITKTTEERLKESMTILQQIKKLGIPATEPGYKELSAKFSEWVKGGPAWSGSVDFHRFNRRAKLTLPTRPGVVAKCDFLHFVF
jgi:hypothetical protein